MKEILQEHPKSARQIFIISWHSRIASNIQLEMTAMLYLIFFLSSISDISRVISSVTHSNHRT